MMHYIENENFRLGARELGAELRSFIDKRSGENYEYLWQGGEPWHGCSPLLFPVIGALREGIYCVDGQEYSLDKHGFARVTRFDLEACDGNEMTFLLKDNEETHSCYPYPFELRMKFVLTENGFRMIHSVRNTGSELMYFSVGAHPGFQCSMGDRVVLDETETADAYIHDEHSLLAKDKVPVFNHSSDIVITPTLFDRGALIFDDLKSNGASLIRSNGRNVHVDFGNAPCLGIWAKPNADYVCIEPWWGIDDHYNSGHDYTKKDFIQTLAAGEEFVFSVTVTV